MDSTKFILKELSKTNKVEIIEFTKKLNPNKSESDLFKNLDDMFEFQNFCILGLVQDERIIGISRMTVRFYSGRQLEVDNFIIDAKIRSQGLGQVFLTLIEEWAKEKGCQTIELNTYVQNSRSHKFYFNSGYSILGFHFQKTI